MEKFRILDSSAEEQQQQVQPVQESADPIQEVVETAEQKEKPRGIITEIGEWMQDNLDPLNVVDRQLEANAELTKSIPIVGDVNRAIADFVPNREESREIIADIPVVGKPAVAVGSGIDAGVASMLPTPLATITNQEASWNNRPSVLTDDDWFSDIVYDVAKITTPLLLLRGAGAPAAMTGTSVESAFETLSQEGADDIVLGREVAGVFGRVYAGISGDPDKGAEFTKALIEGDDLAIQPFLKTWAFLNNYAVNTYAGKILEVGGIAFKKLFTKIANKNGNLEQITKLTGKDTDEVVEEMTTMPQPEFRPDQEPSSAIRPENTSLAPSPGNTVNEAALGNRILSEINGVPMDPNDPSIFFSNWGALSSTEEGIAQLKNVFKNKIPLEPGSVAQARVLKNTANFLLENKYLLETGDSRDFEIFLQQWATSGGFFEQTMPRSANRYSRENLAKLANFTKYFGNYMQIDLNNEEGLTALMVSRFLAEQGGQNLALVANQIMELARKGQNYDDLVDNIFVPNQKFLNAALTPFRFAKRQWNLAGLAQQGRTYNDLLPLLGMPDKEKAGEFVVNPGTGKGIRPLTIDGNLIEINVEGEPFRIDTMEQLWGLAREGNDEARKLFELAMQNIRYGDPDKVLSNLELVSDIVNESLKETKGFERYFYNVVALGQLSTQTNAVGATVFRQVFEPLAMIAGGLNPVNSKQAKQEAMYGLGMFMGGMFHMRSAWESGMRAWKLDAPTRGKSRFTDSYSTNLLKELEKVRSLHADQDLMDMKSGMDPFRLVLRRMGRLMREAAYHPGFNVPTRALMAGDEAASVTTGAQHAWGRAFVNMSEREEFLPWELLEEISVQEKKIFKGPKWKNEIIDAEVVADTERVTLQRGFDINEDMNYVESWFAAQDAANKISPLNRIFNAFPRPAYRQIEQEYVENVLASMPGGVNLNKRLKQIYSQKDPTQRLGIESQKKLAHLVGISATVGAIASLAANEEQPTLTFSGGSLIINGIDADVAIETGKFSPATVYVSILSNIIDAFYSGKTSQQGLEHKLLYLAQATTADIIARNLLQGQQQFSRIVNVESDNWTSSAFTWLWNFISPGVIREIAHLIQPYETVSDVRTDLPTQIGTSAAQMAFGNIQNPALFDIYSRNKTTYPKPRVPASDPSDPNNVRLSVLASYFYPGRVQEQRFNDPVMKMMRVVEYETYNDYIRSIDGIELNAEEQVLLSQGIQGILYKSLAKYEKGAYKKQLELYKKAVKSGNKELAEETKRVIKGKITSIHRSAKQIAAQQVFKDNPRIMEVINKNNQERSKLLSSEPINPEYKGLYATAAQQDTQLASQVREILDFNNA